MNLILIEQNRLCDAHMQILTECFATGKLDSTFENLDYFQDLQALHSEGRYESVLIQIYQLDRKSDSTMSHYQNSVKPQVSHDH
jgi:hypothetical protein